MKDIIAISNGFNAVFGIKKDGTIRDKEISYDEYIEKFNKKGSFRKGA